MTGPALLAALAAAAAAWVCWPPRSRPPSTSGGPAPGIGAVTAASAAAGAVALLAPPSWWVPAGIGAGGLLTAAVLWRNGRAHRRRVRTGARVLEVCEHLAGELGAGLPPSTALGRAVDVWPPLAAVAEADRMGGDVPQALRRLGRAAPGAGELRLLAAAWQVAHRTGQGLTAATERVADELRAAHVTGRVVAGELASARATARLMAVLPVLALLMGSGMGGDPWRFLLATPLGWACLAGGTACAGVGLWWIERLAHGVQGAS